MERSEALKLCKFYHEEEESPYEYTDKRSTFWDLECGWIQLLTGKGSEVRANNYASEFVMDFPDELTYIDIPFDLKSAMYNRYTHFNDGYSDGFINFLLSYVNTQP